eukprot:gnl/MRDRNA2_/MRDRNA2_27625_c0_seq1.p1 gnl/MRDRNA2_/MRDRNA2_27625_c0~~gnl/MRDRNA2_/MRDRNA2_27625_c0_seq1.p1  ORF type:complete len:961 (+),score=222.94 gnl/MRDRNA2_/MRDRNA2_27625_c0_seq1:101-2983(+)
MVNSDNAQGCEVDLEALEQESLSGTTRPCSDNRLLEPGRNRAQQAAMRPVLPSPAGFGRRRDARRAAKGNPVAPLPVPLGNAPATGIPGVGVSAPLLRASKSACTVDTHLFKDTTSLANAPGHNVLEIVRVERDLLRHRCQELAEHLALACNKSTSCNCDPSAEPSEQDLRPVNLSTALVEALETPSPRHLRSEATAALHSAYDALGPDSLVVDAGLARSFQHFPVASPHPVPPEALPGAYEELRTNFYRLASELVNETHACQSLSTEKQQLQEEVVQDGKSLRTSNLQSPVKLLKAELNAAKEEFTALERQNRESLARGRNGPDNLKSELDVTTEECKALRVQNGALRYNDKQMSEQCEALYAEEINVRLSSQKLQQELSAATQECKELEEQRNSLRQRDEDMSREYEALRTEQVHGFWSHQNVQAELSASTAKNKALRSEELHALRSSHELRAEIDSTVQEFRTLQEVASSQDHIFEDLQTQLVAAKEECEALQGQKKALLCRNERMQQETESMCAHEIMERSHARDLQVQLETSALETQGLRTQKEALLAQNQEMSKEVDILGTSQLLLRRNERKLADMSCELSEAKTQEQELRLCLHEAKTELMVHAQAWKRECESRRSEPSESMAEAQEMRVALSNAKKELSESKLEVSNLQEVLGELQKTTSGRQGEALWKEQRAELQAAVREIRNELEDHKTASAANAESDTRLGEALVACGVEIVTQHNGDGCVTASLVDEAVRVLKRQHRRCILLGGRVAELQEEWSQMENSTHELKEDRCSMDELLERERRLEQAFDERGKMLEEVGQERKALELRLLQEARLRESLRAQLTQFTSRRKGSRERRASSASAPRIATPASRSTTPGSGSDCGNVAHSADRHGKGSVTHFTFPLHGDEIVSGQLWSSIGFGEGQRLPLGEITHCTNSACQEDGSRKPRTSVENRRLKKCAQGTENMDINILR